MKRIKFINLLRWLLLLICLMQPGFLKAEISPETTNDLEDKLEAAFALLEAESYVTIATKTPQKIAKAPSIVSVITAEDIERIGARTLPDILMTIPGFDIIKYPTLGEVRFGVRGIARSDEKVKVFINKHSINSPLDGNAIDFIDNLSLKNVKKIEVIRGPGSALYGANAFLAVINITTKDAADIDGVEISSGFGSFDTQEYSILFGKTIHGIDISGFADFYNTNGLSDTIKEDALSSVPFFNRFSIAPGDTDDSRNKLDLHLKLSYKYLTLNARYLNKDTQSFVGGQSILTNGSDLRWNHVMGDLSYKLDIWERLTVKPRFYYDQYDIDLFTGITPDGFTIPFDLDNDGDIEIFPEGMIGNAIATDRRLGGEIEAEYELFDNNLLTFGFNYEWERQDNVNFFTNFDPLTGASLGPSLQDVSETANWIREVTRQIWAIYIQDKWDITDDLGITIGIRHDHYSDFEGTTNPRIGLVWNFMKNADLKLLYGQAFRAPSFFELFTINNPALIGSPDLRPETIRTYELGLGYSFSKSLNANINYFFNVIRDEIGVRPKTSPLEPEIYDNVGGSNIQGIEFELKSNLGNKIDVFANYTYQDAESKGDSLPDVPRHKGNIGINVELSKYLNANLYAFISDKRARAEEDTRDDSPGYSLVNLTLIAKEFFNDMKIRASLFNLLDKDYNDPAPINTIPTDLPRPGRTFYIGVDYKF